MVNFNRRIIEDNIVELCSSEQSEYRVSHYLTLAAGNYSKQNLAELLNSELRKLDFSNKYFSASILVSYNEFIDCFQITTCGIYGAVFDFSDNIKRIYTNFNGKSPLNGPDQFINLHETIRDRIYIPVNEGNRRI
jgi:hypothetical protein